MRSVGAFLQVQSHFRAYSVLEVVQGAGRIAVLAILAIEGVRRAEWYLGAFGGTLAVLFLLCLIVLRQAYLTARWPAPEDAASLWRFLGLTAGVVVVGTISGRTDLLFLASRGDSTALGGYSAASQLASVLTLLAGYASVVVQPVLIASVRRGQLTKLLIENAALAATAGVMVLPVVWRFGEVLMASVFGEGFRASSGLLRIFILGTCLDLLFMPVPMTFVLQFKPRLALLGEVTIGAIYLLAAVPAAMHSAASLAWLVTGVRVAKGALYFAVTFREMREGRARSEASVLR
jgi:O-antigen/teichoic acid export membrane protein